MITVYYTYGLTIVSIFFSTMAGYFYGLCDANMLVLTTGPMAQYVKAGEEMALFDAYAVGVGEQIEELVRRADERMYIEKRHGSGR